MERAYKLVMIGLVGAFILSGCAKPPTQQINDTKAQVEGVTNKDTETYAKEELGKLNKDLTAALDEVKTQDAKFLLKKYDKAKQLLASVKADAENVKTIASQRKEEAKNKAITAQGEAKAAIEAAKVLLAQAPTGKETKADIEAFKADLTGLEDSLPALQQTIDQEKYSDAVNSANIIKEKAASISSQIQQALEKVKEKKVKSSKVKEKVKAPVKEKVKAPKK